MSALRKIPQYVWVAFAAIFGPFVPGMAVAIYNTLFESDIDGVDKMGAHIWAGFWAWAREYVPAHWDRLLWFSAAIVVGWGLVSHGAPFVVRAWKRRILFRRVGIRAYLPRETEDDKAASWNDCVSFLTNDGNDTICILGANGWETFGNPRSPLHDVLQHFRGAVRILLIHPYSAALDTRAASVNETAPRYRKDIFRSINTCRTLKNQGKDIEVRLFDAPAVWKMIFSRDRLWLQHYEDGKHVDHTAVYSFGREPNNSSLYHPFRVEFQRMWERAEMVNLQTNKKVLAKEMAARPRPVICAQCDGTPAGQSRAEAGGHVASSPTDGQAAIPSTAVLG